MEGGRTSYDVTGEPLKEQLETFLDEHRAALRGCLDGLTEEQARRRLVPSETTLLGLVKHATYAERVWFGEAVTGRPRQEMGLPPNAADAFTLADADTIDTVRAAHDEACAASRRATAGLDLDDVLRGHWMGPLPLTSSSKASFPARKETSPIRSASSASTVSPSISSRVACPSPTSRGSR